MYMTSDYKSDMREARDKLSELVRQREELEIEISKQQRRVAALALLSEEGSESEEHLELNLGGLTEAVRSAIRAAGSKGLTPVEIRKSLIQLYFPVADYKNFRGSLHAVLKRLVDAGEVKRAVHDMHEGRDESVYQWVGRRRKT